MFSGIFAKVAGSNSFPRVAPMFTTRAWNCGMCSNKHEAFWKGFDYEESGHSFDSVKGMSKGV
jgi:hypothetical protein